MTMSRLEADLLNAIAAALAGGARNVTVRNDGELLEEIWEGAPLICINADLYEYALQPLDQEYLTDFTQNHAVSGALPMELAAAVFERILQQDLRLLAQAMGISITVTGYRPCKDASKYTRHLDLIIRPSAPPGEHSRELAVRLHFRNDNSVTDLIRNLKLLASENSDADRFCTVTLDRILGWQYLTAAELASLEPGDALMPSVHINDDGRLLLVSEHFSFWAVPQEGNPETAEIIQEGSFKENNHMNSDQNSNVDGLTLRIEFSLGGVSLSMGELRQLGTGSVLNIGGQDLNDIALRINGQNVGRGRLIKVGEDYAVQITEIGTGGR